ncbi:hypothetical protein [Scleromatobacter humisilvae]|uniref:Uncharacterized protein n=1 Tax=Scleromatobacter humisilvae TaxID=2897159 RepID=A0A9X1YQF3_9BURK|nr:hypothetical protein [Scleromatobacter humisilvae]MCK9689002.1 hypothetical protein [Scleromatobacter humisilvae]
MSGTLPPPVAWRVARALCLADLRQRTRSTRFRVAALAITAAGWWCLPPADAGYLVVAIGDHHRGFYSSAWIGMVLAMLSLLWGLVGFYLVRGTVQRDFDTRVWQLLGTTSMRRGAYLLAKWASHVAVMGGLLFATLVVGLVAQLVRAEDRHVDLWELVKPSLFIALPTLAFSAMLAIWFDVVPLLRRTVGNIVFFFVWIGLLTTGPAGIVHDRAARAAGAAASIEQPWTSDLPAMRMMQWSIEHQIARGLPEKTRLEGFCVGCGGVAAPPARFVWTTWEVRGAVLWGRMLWLAAAIAGVLLAVPLLDWAAARAATPASGARRPPRQLRWLRAVLRPLQGTATGVLIAAEAHVVLRQRPGWWWAAWLPLWGVQLFGPRHAVALAMLAGWTMLLDVFARTGLRDHDHRTLELVATAPGARRRLLLARAAMLVGLAWIAAAPGLLHESIVHPGMSTTAFVMAASVALWGLASVALTRSSRPFELAFIVAAYATTQGVAWLDAATRANGVTLAHLAGIVLATAILAVSLRADRPGTRRTP